MEDKFIKLTNTVYKVLEFFPESDPLKTRAKDKALAIMDNLVLANQNFGWASFQNEKIKTQISEDIDILLGYLWIAKTQGWLSSSNCMILCNEYEKIKNEVKPVLAFSNFMPEVKIESPVAEEKKVFFDQPAAPVIGNEDIAKMSERQGKIVEFLQKNRKAQVMDLQAILPNITKRTIRRDLDELLESGKIKRLGEFNEVFYEIV